MATSTPPPVNPDWDYNGDPASGPRHELRFRIGDTNPDCILLTNAEADFLLLDAGGSVRDAAIEALRGLIMKATAAVDESVGSVSLSLSQRLDNLIKALAVLERRLYGRGGGIRMTGISRADKDQARSDGDRVRPYFDAHNERRGESPGTYQDNGLLAPPSEEGP